MILCAPWLGLNLSSRTTNYRNNLLWQWLLQTQIIRLKVIGINSILMHPLNFLKVLVALGAIVSYGSSSIYKAFFSGCGVCEAEAVFQGHKLACDSGLFSFIVELDSLHDLIDLPLWLNMYQYLVTWWLTC